MSRYYQICDITGTWHYTSDDLPLIIGPDPSAHIKVGNKQRVAYIAESEHHLYIQPADSEVELFHNDELLRTSQWIKSGDITRSNKQTITYKIASDRVEITIEEIPEKLYPPTFSPSEKVILPSLETIHKTELPVIEPASQFDNIATPGQYRKYKYAIYAVLSGLLVLALYVLLAKSIEIKIDPRADLLTLSGFPPPVKLGNRFLLLRGEYSLQAEKSGYKTLHKTVSIHDEERIDIKLEKLPGKLKILFPAEIADEPFGADTQTEIFIDEIKVQGKAGKLIEMAAGQHVIEIIKEGYKNFKASVNIQGLGVEQTLNVILKPDWGVLNFRTQPEQSLVSIKSLDDKKYSRFEKIMTSPVTMKLIAGSYTLKIKKIRFKPVKINIQVNAEEIIDLPPVILKSADAFIRINPKPANSMVFLNGEYQGTGIKRIRVSSNIKQKMTISAAGYKDKNLYITLNADEEQDLNVSLQAEMASVFINMNPPHAKLYIDGKPQQKNNGRFRINTREHVIEARAKGYKSKKISLTPDKEFSQQIDIVLKSDKEKIKGHAPLSMSGSTNTGSSQYMTDAGQRMILIRGGEFLMGSAKNEVGRRSNERRYKVKIKRNYFLSDKEITNAQYRMFKPSHFSGKAASQSLNGEQQPVVNISWNDAAKYCNWLSSREGLQPYYKEIKGKMTAVKNASSGAYRLPFESEWSYAARIRKRAKTARYAWSGNYPPTEMAGNFADESARAYLSSIIKGYNDNHIVSSPVGTFKKNPAGIFDLGGNVSEWCHDYYSASSGLTAADKIKIDPTGPNTGSHHVVRDSSWRDASLTELRLAYRSYSLKAKDDIGFRISRYAQ